MASRQILTDTQQGFAGGYNSSGLTEPIAENQFAAMTNVRVLQNGELAKRPGLKSILSLSALPRTLNFWRKDSNTGQVVIVDNAASGTLRLGTFSPTTGVLTVSSSSVPADATLGRAAAHFVTGGADEFYLSSDIGRPYKLTASARLASGPSGINYLWVYSQRLFGVTTSDMTLYWSGLNDGDTLDSTASGGGHATVRSFGGGVLRGGFAVGNLNVLVHDDALSVFEGRTFDDIQIQAGTSGLAAKIGGIYGNSFGVVDDVGYVISSRGLFVVTPDGAVRPYQQPNRVDPIRELIVSSATVDGAFVADNPRANEIWFMVDTHPTSGSSNVPTVFIYHKLLQQFTGKLALPANAAIQGMITGGSMDTGTIRPQLMLAVVTAGGTNAIVACDFQDASLEVFQDLGASYTSSVQCRRFYTSSPRNTKAYRTASVQMGFGGLGNATVGSSTGVTATLTTADGTASTDTSELLAGETTLLQVGGQGQFGTLTITDGGTSSTGWSIAAADVQAFDYGIRGR